MHSHIHLPTHTHTHTHMHTHAHIHSYTHRETCSLTIHAHRCTHTWKHTQHTNIHAYTHLHMHPSHFIPERVFFSSPLLVLLLSSVFHFPVRKRDYFPFPCQKKRLSRTGHSLFCMLQTMWLDFWPAVWRVETWRTPSWPFCWCARVVRRVRMSSLPTHTGSWWAFFRLLQLGLHWCHPDMTVMVDWAYSTKLLTYFHCAHWWGGCGSVLQV